LDDLIDTVRAAHSAKRPVAFHCVARTELVLACAALQAAGSSAADRIEHAAVVPPDTVALLADVGATVVTQPNFIFERGDEYLTDVEARERPWLYRLAGLLDAGIPVGAGTDAPYGDPDPWVAMRTAVSRTTRSGRTIGPEERVTPEHALRLFTSAPQAPGKAARTITVGSPADLCLLERNWRDARERLSSDDVRATIRAGRCIWRRD
jgi:predicted amidohydrolase YtcJ